MTPFYTGLGDSGHTGILGPGRVSKTSTRIEAVGSVDEATAALGLARSLSAEEATQRIIVTIQKTLYLLMAEISADSTAASQFDRISKDDIEWLENEIAGIEAAIDLPREFIIPGVTPASSALSLARTIIRRAERRVLALFEEGEIKKELLIAYLNRLSSLVFTLEIYEIQQTGKKVQLAK